MFHPQLPGFGSQDDTSESHGRARTRVSHTKSRTGCYTCKLRRVKCDEVRPVCGACSLRGNDCSFPMPSRSLSSRRKIGYKAARRAQRADNTSLQILRSGYGNDSSGRKGREGDGREDVFHPLEFNAPESWTNLASSGPSTPSTSDMRLLQHFLMHTSGKMSFHPKRKLVWQRVIPDLAVKEEYLMHLLLALAGAHSMLKTCVQSGEDENTDIRHSDQAGPHDFHLVTEHHQKGLQGFREALSNMSATTAENVFCGSLLLVAFAFASLRIRSLTDVMSPPRHNDAGECPRLDWLHMIRGLTGVVNEHWSVLKVGRLRALLLYAYANDDWKQLPLSSASTFPRIPHCSSRLDKFARGASQALSKLRAFTNQLQQEPDASGDLVTTPTSHNSSSTATFDSTDIPREQALAIEKLEETYMRILYILCFTESEQDCPVPIDVQGDLEDAVVTSWPHLLSKEFVFSLQSGINAGLREAISYTILAHFYLTFVLFEDLWYFEGAFEKEIVKINSLVEDLQNAQLHSLMLFPMGVIAEQ